MEDWNNLSWAFWQTTNYNNILQAHQWSLEKIKKKSHWSKWLITHAIICVLYHKWIQRQKVVNTFSCTTHSVVNTSMYDNEFGVSKIFIKIKNGHVISSWRFWVIFSLYSVVKIFISYRIRRHIFTYQKMLCSVQISWLLVQSSFICHYYSHRVINMIYLF